MPFVLLNFLLCIEIHDIETQFTRTLQTTKIYNVPRHPLRTSNKDSVYSWKWDLVIVDEIQNYTNCESIRCLAMAALCARRRYGLSGTMFTEPSVKRILGYYLILNLPFARNLPAAEKVLYGKSYAGGQTTIVSRTENDAYTLPNVNEQIIDHPMSKEKKLVYLVLKDLMTTLCKQVSHFKKQGDVASMRLFSSYRMAMITYLRQCIVCPLVPITSAFMDFLDFSTEHKSNLSTKFLPC